MVRGITALAGTLFALVFGFILIAAVADAGRAPGGTPAEEPAVMPAVVELPVVWGPVLPFSSPERGVPFGSLSPVRIANVNTRKAAALQLYDARGRIEEAAVAELDELLCDARDPGNVRTTVLDRRLLQLLYRAAYHFRAKKVQVISAFREAGQKSEGRHALGRAIDFRLANVSPSALAVYLRGQARVGVGLYTHPGTQFVHLDVRDQSYFWLDTSGPGRRGTMHQMGGGRRVVARDAVYAPSGDWPEGTRPSPALFVDMTENDN